MNFMFEDFSTRENLISCDDAVHGRPRFQVSPMVNTICRMKTMGDLMTHDNNKYLISVGVNGSIAEWAKGHCISEKSLFDFLSEAYLTKLRDGTAMLLIDFSLEGYQEDWLFSWFHSECERLKIPPQAVIYITGNMLVDEQYEEYADMRGLDNRIKCIPYAGFEEFIYTSSRVSPPLYLDKHLEYKKNNETWTFNCPQKRPRFHRKMFLDKLMTTGLVDRGLCSFPDRGLLINEEEHTDDMFYYIARTHPEYCLKTYVTVVSEPQYYEKELSTFTSEKVFKPIACGHPFIVLGGQRSLEILRGRGYKTFSDYFDESYDTLPDTQRMDAIIDVLKYIDSIEDKVAWFESMKPVLQHNLDQLKENSSKPDIAIVELQRYYEDYLNA
jgi:hypothetical protein